jgi:RNA polymerase sigma factor (TIGR02999 family)
LAGSEVDRLLEALRAGKTETFESLVSLVYGELRTMAQSLMSRQKPGHTLQPTALVNEAYLKLVQGETNFESRAHFFGAAARAMRQVLIAHARKHNAAKRPGSSQRVTFNEMSIQAHEPDLDVLALDEALSALAGHDGRLARVLEMRYFAGFGLEEIARINGQSLATVKRDWTFARAWLLDYMQQ